MMKWGRKNPSLSSPPPQSTVNSRLFSVSWLSKLRKSSSKTPEGKLDSRVPTSPGHSGCRGSGLESWGHGGSWQVNSGDEVQARGSCRGNCRTNGIAKRKVQKPRQIWMNGEGKEGGKDESFERTYKRIMEATSELQKELEMAEEGYRKSVEMPLKETGKANPTLVKHQRQSYHVKTSDEDLISEKLNSGEIIDLLAEEMKSNWQKLKESKINELTSKSENQRKSVYIGRESPVKRLKHRKIRVRSPRMPSKTESCKIKAIEDMRKVKMKKKINETGSENAAGSLESCAVVKCSVNPKQDFRESMFEMIIEKKITRPDELEELLACYLTLNSEEYHDLIIKVFRGVWHELGDSYFGNKSKDEDEHCCNE